MLDKAHLCFRHLVCCVVTCRLVSGLVQPPVLSPASITQRMGVNRSCLLGQTTVSFGRDETFGINQLGPTGMHGARLQPFNWCVGNGWSERVLSAREGGMVGFSAWR